MSTLSAKQRDHLSANQFALSGDRYPINDVAHARNALARAAQQHNSGNLSDAEYHQVERKANNFLNAHEGAARHHDTVK